MSVVIRDLSVLAYAQGFTLWHYKAPSLALDTVDEPGFFDPASDMFAAGDMLMISAQNGGRVVMVAPIGGAGTNRQVQCLPLG